MRLTAIKLIAFLAMAGGLFLSAGTARASVVGSLHDLSTAGQPQVCIFCHTPHNANLNAAPLWNKTINPGAITFTFYTSITRTVKPAGSAPSLLSLACLSCHTEQLGLDADPHSMMNGGPLDGAACNKCHAGTLVPLEGAIKPGYRFKIGPDLMNDHPVSVPYPLTGTSKLNVPTDGKDGWTATKVRLFNGKLECSSCHNPHLTTHGKFLTRDNGNSALCLTCHNK